MAFLEKNALNEIGFKSVGKSVRISDKCSIYSPEKISIGNNVRIDDYCILSASGENGYLSISSNIHIATFVCLYGGGGIEISDFCSISTKTTLYSTSDDYSGEFLVGPVFPDDFTNVDRRAIVMEKFSQIGAHSLILPGVRMKEGSVLGAMSMAVENLSCWSIYVGSPSKKIKKRKKDIVRLTSRINK